MLVLLIAATYSDVLGHTFLPTWDDPFYITENPAVRGITPGNIAAAFSTNYHGNYAPVQIVSYMIDHAIWGMRPFGFLLSNLIIHTASGLLLYRLLLRQGFWPWGAFLGSALFLVHPVQVESVAWLSQRKNLLAMFFFLAAFHYWLEYRSQEGRVPRVSYCLSLAALLLSLLSKPVAAIFPVMLILYDFLSPPDGKERRGLIDKIPFLVMALAVAVISIVLQSPESGGGRTGYPEGGVATIFMTMLTVLAGYLRLLLWPAPGSLSAIYEPPLHMSIDAEVIYGAGIAILLAAAGVRLLRYSRKPFFWYALFFLGLAPVSQVVPLITIMNDRYLYFPMLGVAGTVAWGCGEARSRVGIPLIRRALVAVMVCLVMTLALASHQRGKVWKDGISLFDDTLPKVENRRQQWFMLADAFRAEGDEYSAGICDERGMLPGALDETDIVQLGRIYFSRGEPEKARALAVRLGKRERWRHAARVLEEEYRARRGAASGPDVRRRGDGWKP